MVLLLLFSWGAGNPSQVVSTTGLVQSLPGAGHGAGPLLFKHTSFPQSFPMTTSSEPPQADAARRGVLSSFLTASATRAGKAHGLHIGVWKN